MMSLRQIRRLGFSLLACGVFGLLLSGTANAAMVGTIDAIEPQGAANAREEIKALAQRPELADKLIAAGVAPNEVEGRVNAMTDAEVLAVAEKLAELPAGGAIGTNELIIILLLIIVIILVL